MRGNVGNDTLSLQLIELGLAKWVPVLYRWLARYDGIEEFVEVGDVPYRAVTKLLVSYNVTPDEVELATALGGLAFLAVHVRYLDGPIWDVRSESFNDFRSRGPIRIWIGPESYPTVESVRDWLLAQLGAKHTFH